MVRCVWSNMFWYSTFSSDCRDCCRRPLQLRMHRSGISMLLPICARDLAHRLTPCDLQWSHRWTTHRNAISCRQVLRTSPHRCECQCAYPNRPAKKKNNRNLMNCSTPRPPFSLLPPYVSIVPHILDRLYHMQSSFNTAYGMVGSWLPSIRVKHRHTIIAISQQFDAQTMIILRNECTIYV